MKEGWQTRPVGEILLPQSTINPLLQPEREFTYIDVSSVSSVTYTIQSPQTILGKDAPSRARRLVHTNDVVFATIRPTLKRIALIPEELDGEVCSTGYVVLRPKPILHPSYLFYWLFTDDFSGQMTGLQRGASYPAVSDADVFQQPISFPDREEQERIVAILDQAFAGIAAAQANAGANFKETIRILDLHRDLIFTASTAKHRRPLIHIASFRNGVNFTKNSKGRTVKIVGVRDFQRRFSVPIDNLDTVTIDGEINSDDLLASGDLLTVRSNGNIELIGRTMLTEECPPNTLHSGFTIRTRLAVDDVSPRYLCHFMRSSSTRKLLIDGGIGTNIKSLSQAGLSKLLLPIPSLEEQNALAATLDELSRETERLQSVYQQKLTALAALKQSLLHQAFSGNL